MIDQMPHRDVIFWNTNALRVAQRQQAGESIQIFSRYEQIWRNETNEITLTVCVSSFLHFLLQRFDPSASLSRALFGDKSQFI